ncbi:hypothetical protein ACOMHN_010432 [Nucella lapillus]
MQVERGQLVLFVVTALVWASGVDGYACDEQSHLTICPFPVLLGPGKNFTVSFVCKVGDIGLLQKLSIGIMSLNNARVTAFKFVGEPPKYRSEGLLYNPVSPSNLSDTVSTLTLTLSPAHMQDLDNEWFCEVGYRLTPGAEVRFFAQYRRMAAFPYPSGTTLDRRPDKPSYTDGEVVVVHCRGLYSLSINRDKTLAYRFQYLKETDRAWSLNVSGQTNGIFDGDRVRRGSFYFVTKDMRLRVASIPGCSRLYRCIPISYDKKFLADEAVETIIRVTPCYGGCSCNRTPIDGQGSGVSGSTPGGSGNGTSFRTSTVEGSGEQAHTAASLSGGLLAGVSILLAAIILALAIILFVVRRHCRKKLRPSQSRQGGGDRIVVVPVAASAVSSLYDGGDPSSVGLHGDLYSSQASGTSFASQSGYNPDPTSSVSGSEFTSAASSQQPGYYYQM